MSDPDEEARLYDTIKQMFDKFDVNGDGKIERWELKQVLQLLDPVSFTSAAVDKIFRSIVSSGEGAIDPGESISTYQFLTWVFKEKKLEGTESSRIRMEAIEAGLIEKSGEIAQLRVITTSCSKGMRWLKDVMRKSAPEQEPVVKATPAPVVSKEDKETAISANRDFVSRLDFIIRVPLFRCIRRDELNRVALAMEEVSFSAGESVIRQGEVGRDFFVIQAGQAEVTHAPESDVKPHRIASLKVGDYFGENELLRDAERTISVVSVTALTCLKMTRAKFHELNLGEHFHFPRRDHANVFSGKSVEVDGKPPAEKTDEQRTLIAEALRNNANLSVVLPSHEEELCHRIDSIVQLAWEQKLQAGTSVVSEGEDNRFLYIVQSGALERFSSSCDGLPHELPPGTCFNELALLYLVPSHCTIRAKEDSVLWVVSKTQFAMTVMKASAENISRYYGYLEKVDEFNVLLSEEKRQLAEAAVEMNFAKGEQIYAQGDRGSAMYILYGGRLSVEKDGELAAEISGTETHAAIFGQGALLEEETRQSSVTVLSETAKAIALDRDTVDALCGPLREILSSRSTNMPRTCKPEGEPILLEDLKRVGLIGCGGFGAVECCEHKETGEVYALKGISKGYAVKIGIQKKLMNEKRIGFLVNSPFVIRLFETYNGTQQLYFLMEMCHGGELYATYNRRGFHGSEPHAKFYAAAVVFGLEHLHELRILYRDIKPENILIDATGNSKFVDFDLSKQIVGKTYTTCGTPDYFAPELIKAKGHDLSLDWWGLGILIFELLTGAPPFESATPMQIYQKVTKGIDKVEMPLKCRGIAESMVKELLKQDPQQRLPMRTGGTSNIKNHPWYAAYDWDAHFNLTKEPPYKPVLKGKTDISNFTARKEDMPPLIEYRDNGSGWDKAFQESSSSR